jgi:phage-related minor tail protein
MADDIDSASGLLDTMDGLGGRTRALTAGATGFASAMSRAFNQSVIQGKQLDDVLKGLALRLSNMAVTAAFKPIAAGLAGGLDNLFGGLFAGGSGGGNSIKAAMGAIKPFAAGGVIGTPTYFPLTQGGIGLAGEAGPEAILPLARGADGRLGVAASGQRGGNVTIHIATPDAESFRRSETYITGQIARAVARGQRSL